MLRKLLTYSFVFVGGGLALNLSLNLSTAGAVPLVDATNQRATFSFPNGDVKTSSYDGPAFDGFSSFASFVSPELLSVNSFTGQPLGSQLEFTMLSESAAFDGTSAGFANKFGVKDSNGNFTSLIDTQSKTAGASASIFQGASDSLTLALQSPEGLFTSIDGTNPDGAAHLIAMKVTQAGEYEINPTSLRNTPPLKFNFLEGDIILFWEDMAATGNLTKFLVPANGDFDYNDMVLVARQTQVPEPASALLLGLAGLGALRRRTRRA